MNGGDPWVDDWERPLVVEEEIGLFRYHVNCIWHGSLHRYAIEPDSTTELDGSLQ